MEQYWKNNTGLNWALRGWIATLGVALCLMLFVFTGHGDYRQHLADLENAAKSAELSEIAQDYVEWRRTNDAVDPSAINLLQLTEATSTTVAQMVSFDFMQIDEASVNAQERKCLAEAIYYEAGYEPVIGRMAVADVILNRVKSAQYPDSICGVVYQGSHRKTGCQFSFTCDGSLNRKLHARTYTSATKMANAIMAGLHLPVSNNATHYHADYVSPYWAPKLTPTAQIGTHKFYKYPSRRRQTITAAAQ